MFFCGGYEEDFSEAAVFHGLSEIRIIFHSASDSRILEMPRKSWKVAAFGDQCCQNCHHSATLYTPVLAAAIRYR